MRKQAAGIPDFAEDTLVARETGTIIVRHKYHDKYVLPSNSPCIVLIDDF